jgi:dephospho-CoA kinase
LSSRPLRIGLAGKAAAGKDTLLPVFEARGFVVIDADKIGHGALDALTEPVRARFGTTDRKQLGRLVFSDSQALADLEALVHPWIRAKIEKALQAHARQPVVINAALLIKLDLEPFLDAVVWVTAPWWVRLARARRRDRLPWRVLLGRLWAQRKLGAQDFSGNVDSYSVENRNDPERARVAVAALLDRLMPVFPERKP